MSGSIASGAAYARSASLSISSSNGPQGPQTDRGATSIGSGSKLGNVQNTAASVRTATVTQAKPEHEAYGWRDALKDLGSVLSGVAKHPVTRLFLGVALMAAGVALAATGVGVAVIGLGMGAAMVGLGTAGTGVFGLITRHTDPEETPKLHIPQERGGAPAAGSWEALEESHYSSVDPSRYDKDDDFIVRSEDSSESPKQLVPADRESVPGSDPSDADTNMNFANVYR